MSRIIGVLNYKGGTGKTTTVVNLGLALSMRGARVLLVDMDAQGNLATYLGVSYRYTLAHMLLGQAPPNACIVKARENLDLIPSDRFLFKAEATLWRTIQGNRANEILTRRMLGVNGYDYVILDFSPSDSLLSDAGLLYARELIVPVSMDYLALVGTRQVLSTLKRISKNPHYHIRLYLILPTFYYGRLRKDRQIMETLRKYFSGRLADPIRSSVKLSEAPSHQASIQEYEPRSFGAVDYARLAERVAGDG